MRHGAKKTEMSGEENTTRVTQQDQGDVPLFYMRQFHDGDFMVHSVARFPFEAIFAVKQFLVDIYFREAHYSDGRIRFHLNDKQWLMIIRKDGEKMWHITTVGGADYCITKTVLAIIVQGLREKGIEIFTPSEDYECVTPHMAEPDRLYMCTTAYDRMQCSPTTVQQADEDEKKWKERREKGQRVDTELDNLHKRLKVTTGADAEKE